MTSFSIGSQVTSEVAEHLAGAAVAVQPYEKVLEDVTAAGEAGTRIWMDPSQVSGLEEPHRRSGMWASSSLLGQHSCVPLRRAGASGCMPPRCGTPASLSDT